MCVLCYLPSIKASYLLPWELNSTENSEAPPSITEGRHTNACVQPGNT